MQFESHIQKNSRAHSETNEGFDSNSRFQNGSQSKQSQFNPHAQSCLDAQFKVALQNTVNPQSDSDSHLSVNARSTIDTQSSDNLRSTSDLQSSDNRQSTSDSQSSDKPGPTDDSQSEPLHTDPKTNYQIPPLTPDQKTFFLQTISKGRNFNSASAEVLQTIIDVDRTHFHELFSLENAKDYAVRVMNLTPNLAWTFYYIALKCREVPNLNSAVQKGDISISAARRLVPIIDKDNQAHWIEKAKSMPITKLEREVANASPLEHAHTTERVKPIPNDLMRVEFSLTENEAEMLHRAREVLSQKLKKTVSLREVFVEALKLVCDKHDPLEKAKRHRQRAEKNANRNHQRTDKDAKHNSSSGINMSGPSAEEQTTDKGRPASSSRDEIWRRSYKRVLIPAHLRHAVNLRDQRRCQFKRYDGTICGSRRFLDHHHIILVSEGGTNTLENITTLCSRCHRRLHERRASEAHNTS